MRKQLFAGVLTCILLNSGCSRKTENVSYIADSMTGALKELYIAGDTVMNWIMPADGSQYSWVDSTYGWGLGVISIEGTQHRWGTPLDIVTLDDMMNVSYNVAGIDISVIRNWNKDGNLVETYRFENNGFSDISIDDIAIHTPFNDNYPDSKTCFEARCNAHIWTGGHDAYVFCTRMSGQKGGLGLIVCEGSINGYEVSERSSNKGSSNFRGVFSLNPSLRKLEAGKSYELKWMLLAADDWSDFQSKSLNYGQIQAEADRYLLECGEDVTISFRSNNPYFEGRLMLDGTQISSVNGNESSYTTSFDSPGKKILKLQYGDDRETYIECMIISNVDSLIDRRAHFVADNQQLRLKNDLRDGALIVYDNETETKYINGESGRRRSDCDEGRERVCMGILLARQYARTSDKKLLSALEDYVEFVRRLQKTDYTTNSTVDFKSKNRGYNYPWVADFWFTMFETTGEVGYLKDGYHTLRAMKRYFKSGFYCIGIPTRGYTLLEDAGFKAQADTLLLDFKEWADTFCNNGVYYPSSEVNYEQSIVGPSIVHLLNVYLLTGESKYLESAKLQMPLLESFNGRQPSFHLNDIAIRHWDGYWFGKDQVWGDTFPHYWSTITGVAFKLYAKATGQQEYSERALNIFRNNLCLFTEEGRASCAFIYPKKIDGRNAYFYDPFANDQDWAMVYWLQYVDAFD